MKKALLLLIILGMLAVVASPVMSAWDDQNYKFTTYNNVGVGKNTTWNTKSGVMRFYDLIGSVDGTATGKAPVYYLFVYGGVISVNTTFPNKGGN